VDIATPGRISRAGLRNGCRLWRAFRGGRSSALRRKRDLALSALALHSRQRFTGQIRFALKPDGLFRGNIGRDAHQLQALPRRIRNQGGRVAPFADVRNWALLRRAWLRVTVVDCTASSCAYGSPLNLMHDLRKMGATTT
jgi:hypothetical protein